MDERAAANVDRRDQHPRGVSPFGGAQTWGEGIELGCSDVGQQQRRSTSVTRVGRSINEPWVLYSVHRIRRHIRTSSFVTLTRGYAFGIFFFLVNKSASAIVNYGKSILPGPGYQQIPALLVFHVARRRSIWDRV